MNVQPAYFEHIRLNATRRWEQLAQDPEIAGPWHQLFKQVQSPRHVLSELLQNADDAQATEASVRIEGGIFIFEHNGEDFTEENFASLCRFGYSNKRALHTIGFRGIGFKSTFSLGDCVELYTPTLSVSFDRKRFTEPCWRSDRPDTTGKTRISVRIYDQHRQKQLEKNLEEWLKSPTSLLFFKQIRRLQIGDRNVHWSVAKPGPIPNSQWMRLNEQEDNTFLLIQSTAERFPDEALAEIKQERMLGDEEDMEFPPCTVEIVLGAKGQLFVVLPTGVQTKLPFACNAPFVQDPARLKIKEPETSSTNRWLLERAGQLAASAMLNWLGETKLPVEERARAYGFFPDTNRPDNTLESACGTIVESAFLEAIAGRPFLLTDNGKLTCEKGSIIIPPQVFDIWSAKQAAELLDEKARPPMSRNVDVADQKKLLRNGVVEQIDKQVLLRLLLSKHLPKPKTWRQLLNLWVYITPEVTNYAALLSADRLRIMPVQGKEVLYSAVEIVRLGEKKLLQSEQDWEFLAAHLLVLNQNWPRFLSEQRRGAIEQKNPSTQKAINGAYAVLDKVGITDISDANKVIARVAEEFFSQKSISRQDCIRLAQIAAKLGALAGSSFQFVTRENYRRRTSDTIIFDEDGTLEELLPAQYRDTKLLHSDYTARFSACSREEWLRWVSSGRASLLTFIPFNSSRKGIHSRKLVEQEARKRGLKWDIGYLFKTNKFIIEDWNYEEIYWQHWKALAVDDERVWIKIVGHILRQRAEYWNRAKSAQLIQIATTGNARALTDESLLPIWVLQLQEVRCLPDTRDFPQQPGDLLRRTFETESLIDVEPFVHRNFDNEVARPLLDLLGVRSTPTGPDRLLDRLRALAKAKSPPIHEVEKWYFRLDQMIETCSTSDFQKIKQAFWSEKLIFTQDNGWAKANEVFLSSDDEDVPGVAVIRSSVRDLMLWSKLNIAPRATAELAIQWLKGLPSGGVLLPPDDARRVRALLARYPERIWNECLHWINLAGEWTPIERFSYVLSMQSLIPWQHLHQWVKQKTADLRALSRDLTGNAPFSALPSLAQCLEEQFNQELFIGRRIEEKEWLKTIGAELCRVEVDTEVDTQRIRTVAERLTRTEWYPTQILEVIPYLEGTPAGTPRQADVLWFDQILYVAQLPKAKLAKRVPDEIGKAFSRDDIKAALDYSFERSPEDVREYLEANFKLAPHTSIPELTSDTADVNAAKEPRISPLDPDTDAYQEPEIPNQVDDEVVSEQPDDAEPDTISNDDQPSARSRSAPKPAKPRMIERFAKTQGFRKDGEDRFFHGDGSWIGRTNGSGFPWERRTKTGDLVRYYWLKDHSLDREPLQLETDIWGMLESHPETHALILVNAEDDLVEMTGARLCALRKEGKITLNPATYRLVYSNDDHI